MRQQLPGLPKIEYTWWQLKGKRNALTFKCCFQCKYNCC